MSEQSVTSVSRRGQTVVPSTIRRRHHIREGDRLVWLDDGREIRVVPLPENAVARLRGHGRGEGLLDALLRERRRERRSGR